MARDSFVFFFEWAEILLGYPAEVRLEVYDAIVRYAQSGTLSELKPQAAMAFAFIKREIDRNAQRYDAICERRKKAGCIGGTAKAANAKQNVANVANATFATNGLANVANATFATNGLANVAKLSKRSYNDNDNDNDNDVTYVTKENLLTQVKESAASAEPPQPMPQRKTFVKPQREEVEAYMATLPAVANHNLRAAEQAAAFCDYYESNGWRVGRNPMKDWRAAARGWCQRAATDTRYPSRAAAAMSVTHFEGEGDRSIYDHEMDNWR